MATNYGETLGLGAIGMILALLVTQIVAVPFSILFGNLAKKVGAMRMIAIAVCVYFVITILGFFMGFNIEQAELSGGETQRLMLARALYKDGPSARCRAAYRRSPAAISGSLSRRSVPMNTTASLIYSANSPA